MLDVIGIFFSSVMMLLIIVQAVRLDQTRPWFEIIKQREKPAAEKTRAWRRRG
jgi:hypothetical protein